MSNEQEELKKVVLVVVLMAVGFTVLMLVLDAYDMFFAHPSSGFILNNGLIIKLLSMVKLFLQ